MPCSFLSLHRRSIRLDGFDYSRAGWYFVTICCDEHVIQEGRYPWRGRSGPFGSIGRAGLRHTSLGKLVHGEWNRLGERFAWAKLDKFVVMPDHLHGLVHLGRQEQSSRTTSSDCGLPAGSLPKLLQAFKSTTTWRAKRELDVAADSGARLWQRNYYESIIRGERHLAAVRRYIIDNPERMMSRAR